MNQRQFLEDTYLNLFAQLSWATDFSAVSRHPDGFLVSRIIDGFQYLQQKQTEEAERNAHNLESS